MRCGKDKRRQDGITLIALVITIILLVILAGVTINTIVGEDGIITNTYNAVEASNIATAKDEIQMVILQLMTSKDRDVTLEEIIDKLIEKGITTEENASRENGQVKTEPDGYVYEIKEDANGNWVVEYTGKGEIEKPEITISLSQDTTGIANTVTITVTAKAESGIKSYTPPGGTAKTYSSGTTEISETYEVTANGTYTFTISNNNGTTESKTITINNILEGTIEISAEPTEPTKGSVVVTVEWPSGSSKGTQEIRVDEGEWQTVSGDTSKTTVNQNCTIRARVSKSSTEIIANTITIGNIDKLAPSTFTLAATATSNSITISGSTTDQAATSQYASSGIEAYYFRIDGGEWKTNTDPTETSYTFTELTQGTSHTVQMKVVDKAGNETTTESVTRETNSIAGGTDITINLSTTEWTAEPITVSVTWPSNTEGLTKQISIDGGSTWSTYTGEVTVSSNCTVKARLIDESNQSGEAASITIDKIDVNAPTVSATSGTDTITEGDSKEVSTYFTYSANGTAPVTVTYTVNGSEISNTNTLSAGTHTITCTVTKATGAVASVTKTVVVESAGGNGGTAAEIASNPSEYYGGEVTNYTCTNSAGVNAWKIFYADSSNIYLIADDYIHYDYAPKSANNTLYKNSDYRMSFDNVYKDYTGGANITDSRIKKWISYINDNGSNTNTNIRAVAFMLDVDIWSAKFGNSTYAEYAIGGPTLDMFVASYNQTHSDKRIEYTHNSTGYQVKWSTDSSYNTYISGLNTSESLYVISDPSKAYAMWLAAPSAFSANYVMYVYYGGNVSAYYCNGNLPGFRPLVCLKSDVQLEKQEEGKYIIK